MRKLIYLFFGACLSATFFGCAQKQTSHDSRLYVVTTTGMIADAARNIGGQYVRVDGLMGPGVDPHLYKATQSDISTLSGADLILYNGLHLEGKMAEIFEEMARTKRTVAVSENVPEEKLRAPKDYQVQHDPHIWFDVTIWRMACQRVAEALSDADTAHASIYMKNFATYADSLDTLNAWVKRRITEIPEEDRVMVTAHDAFEYFGAQYGLEVRGLQGISTASEYGLNDVTQMVDMLTQRKIRAVFVESSVPKRAINAVVEGCQSRGHDIVIGGELFSDAMGADGTPEGNYLGMVRHNVNTIVEALK